MSGDLLQTKLYIPRLRPSRILRPHLIKQPDQGLQQGGKLTLISALAGFCKTMLITEWIEQIHKNHLLFHYHRQQWFKPLIKERARPRQKSSRR